MHRKRDGMGLGGYCEGSHLLDVHWKLRSRGRLMADQGLMIGGAIYISAVNEPPTEGNWTAVDNSLGLYIWKKQEA